MKFVCVFCVSDQLCGWLVECVEERERDRHLLIQVEIDGGERGMAMYK